MSFIDIPNVPGVPPLPSFSPNNTQLILADVGIITQLLFPTWGIYLNGVPVIQPATPVSQGFAPVLNFVGELASLIGEPNIVPVTASLVEFAYDQDWRIPDYPVEQGGFQSYDKVQLPFDVRVRLASTAGQGFLSTVSAIANSLALFDVVTPDYVYTSVNCNHFDFRRTSRNGVELIVVEMWFIEIRESSTTFFQNTQVPGIAGQQSIGQQQALTPNQVVSQEFSAYGGPS